jgi:hypothetical protein
MTSVESIKTYLKNLKKYSEEGSQHELEWSRYYHDEYLFIEEEKNNIQIFQTKMLPSEFLKNLNLTNLEQTHSFYELKTTPSRLKIGLYRSKLAIMNPKSELSSEAFPSWAIDALKINPETLFRLMENDRQRTLPSIHEDLELGLRIFLTKEFMSLKTFKVKDNKFFSEALKKSESLKNIFKRVKFLQDLGAHFEYILTHHEEEWMRFKDSEHYNRLIEALERFWSSEITQKAIKGATFSLPSCKNFGEKLAVLNRIMIYEKHQPDLWAELNKNNHIKNHSRLFELKNNCEDIFTVILQDTL